MESLKITFNEIVIVGAEFSKFGYKYATLLIFLSLFLSILSWVLSYLYKKFPSNFYKLLGVITIVTGVMALLINLICSHLMVLNYGTDPVNKCTVIFCFCLFAVQLNYLRHGFKVSYVFTTSALALLMSLLMFYNLPKILEMGAAIDMGQPVYNYYTPYMIAAVVLDNNKGVMQIIKRQTWINRIQLLDRFMPTKNINEYILSSVATFSYSSLILWMLLSRDINSFGFIEYITLGWVSVSLLFSGVISFALLVKYEDAANQVFPGCLFIYYMKQAYLCCKNLIYGNIDPSPKFNWKNFFFAFLLIISSLGPTAFGVTSVTPEPVGLAANNPGTSSSVPAGSVVESSVPAGSVVEESVRRVQVSPAFEPVGLTAHDPASSSGAQNQDIGNLLHVFIDPETNVFTFHKPGAPQSSEAENPKFNRLLQVSVDYESGDLVAHEPGRPVAEGARLSRAAGENVRWASREFWQGARNVPYIVGEEMGTLPSRIISTAMGAKLLQIMSTDPQEPSTSNAESSQAQLIEGLQKENQELTQKNQELIEKNKKLEEQVNSSFFNRFFSCFKSTDSTAAKHAAQSETPSASAEPRS